MVRGMKQTFHYEHHRAEALRTRRRFAGLNVFLFAGAAVLIGLQYAASHAATSVTISGRVYNSSTGAGYPNVTLATCLSNPTQVTNSSGAFSFSFPQGTSYCIRISSFPYSTTTLNGPTALHNNSANSTSGSYEFQRAGENCYQNASCNVNDRVYDRNFSSTTADTSMDIAYANKPTPVPTPTPTPVPATPVKTPVPTPVKTPVPTPRPTVKTPTPQPVGGLGAGPTAATTPAAAAADTTPPSAVGNFQALAAGNNALVKLSWTAATDAVGVASYHIERSTDQTTWNVVADQSQLAFEDATANFGIHYYYRLSAFDAAGNQGPYATADATTAAFSGTSNAAADTVTSDDNLVTVTIPSGAFDDEADCTVTTASSAVTTGSRTLIAGPYQLICKDSSGNVLLTTKSPLGWTYNVKAKIGGFINPTVVSISSAGTQSSVTPVTYDKKAGSVSFSTATLGTTAVLASVKAGFPVSLVVFTLLAIAVIVIVLVFVLRKKQKTNYDDYIRSKYYDL